MQAYNSLIINAGGDVNLSPEQIKNYQDSFKDSKKLTQQAVDALAPSKLSPNSTLEIENIPELNTDAALLEIIPIDYQPPKQEEKLQPYENVNLVIFASDQDKSKTGWAGVVPDIFTKRVKFILGDDVKPEVLHGNKHVKADVVVKEKFNSNKNRYEPYEVLIVAIN